MSARGVIWADDADVLGLPQCAVVLFKLVGLGGQKVAFNFGIVKL